MSQTRKESYHFDLLFSSMKNMAKIFKEGNKSKFYFKLENIALILVMSISLSLFVERRDFDVIFKYLSMDIFILPMNYILNHMSFFAEIILSLVFVTSCFFIIYGWRAYSLFKRYQRAIDRLGYMTELGERPKLIQVTSIDDSRTRLHVNSIGIGEERYKTKLDDLRASFGQKVESVHFDKNDNSKVEIFLAKRLLDSKILYADFASELKRPYSFIVGKSQRGIITENLEEVPHYMIAGSTDGGKSVALKSMILGLLESSTKLQLYLFDFKRVELGEFSVLPNVTVAKEVVLAQHLLENLEIEMERRYNLLEKNGYKKIDPTRDNLNRIVVVIDECTNLTGKVARNHPLYPTIEAARNSLDHLARKARAAGIHLIFATQKIDKHTMDTRVQENVEGRISFRMNTIENSVRVLQNGMSYNLPSIAGRAIWKRGADYTEVQCPFLTDDELRHRIDKIIDSKKFEKQINLQIRVSKEIKEKVSKNFTADEDIGNEN